MSTTRKKKIKEVKAESVSMKCLRTSRKVKPMGVLENLTLSTLTEKGRSSARCRWPVLRPSPVQLLTICMPACVCGCGGCGVVVCVVCVM